MSRTLRHRHTDERDAGGLGAASIVHRIAEIPDVLVRVMLTDKLQAIRRGFWIGNAFVSNYGIERHMGSITAECYVGFILGAAGENCQRRARCEALQQTISGHPLFVANQAI